MTDQRRPVSLIWYLIGFIALIVGIVVALSLTVSYLAAEQAIRQDFRILEDNSVNNAVESAWMVSTGLELIDEDMNPSLNRSLVLFRDAYIKSGNDPAKMDLSGLRDTIALSFEGDVNLYIFNQDGIIEYSTLPEVRGVDFRQYPDFYRELTRIRLGSAFAKHLNSPQPQQSQRIPNHRFAALSLFAGSFHQEGSLPASSM